MTVVIAHDPQVTHRPAVLPYLPMTNPRMQNTEYLRNVAYSDATNLNARIRFWQLYGQPRDEAFRGYFDRFGSMQVPPNATVLDLGCGPAHYWQWGLANDRVPEGWQITLTDLSQGMLDEAGRNTSEPTDPPKGQFTFEIADVCELPFDDASFDLVTANYMLYHAASQRTAIAEIHRVLKPGGRLYAATNSINHIVEILDLQRAHVTDESELENIGLAHAAFTLENGASMLSEKFSKIETVHDKSICKATDPQVVIDYVLSMDAKLNEQKLEETVRTEINRNGHLAVTRSSGTLIAQK